MWPASKASITHSQDAGRWANGSFRSQDTAIPRRTRMGFHGTCHCQGQEWAWTQRAAHFFVRAVESPGLSSPVPEQVRYRPLAGLRVVSVDEVGSLQSPLPNEKVEKDGNVMC